MELRQGAKKVGMALWVPADKFWRVAIFFEVQCLAFARDVAVIGKVVDCRADIGKIAIGYLKLAMARVCDPTHVKSPRV